MSEKDLIWMCALIFGRTSVWWVSSLCRNVGVGFQWHFFLWLSSLCAGLDFRIECWCSLEFLNLNILVFFPPLVFDIEERLCDMSLVYCFWYMTSSICVGKGEAVWPVPAAWKLSEEFVAIFTATELQGNAVQFKRPHTVCYYFGLSNPFSVW